MDRNRNIRGLLAALLVAAYVAAPVRAANYGQIEVRVESTHKVASSHGYTEFMATVISQAKQTTHNVTLRVASDARGYAGSSQDTIRSVSRTVALGPGATARVALFIPGPNDLDSELRVSIDGRLQESTIRMTIPTFLMPDHNGHGFSRRSGRMTFSAGELNPVVFVGSAVQNDWMDRAKAHQRMEGRFAIEQALELVRADSPVAAWSTSWLAYSRYDGIVLTADEWSKVPGAVRTALLQFTEGGGVLLVLGNMADPPEAWRRTNDQGMTVYQAGFGQCIVAESGIGAFWGREQLDLLTASLKRSMQAQQKNQFVDSLESSFPVVEKVTLPVREMFALMLVFAIFIGPVNLYLLARFRRRIWMLWTVPAISFVTCLMIFGTMLLLEGWSGHIRTETVTILDEGSHRATTIGLTGVYSPVTLSDGLHFSYETEVAGNVNREVRYDPSNNVGSSRTLDWSQDQHLAQGWVKPRVTAHFMVRKCESRRERLTFRRGKDGSLTVVNGLGAPLKLLRYADEKGGLYGASDIPAGGEAALSPIKADEIKAVPALDLRNIYSNTWQPNALSELRTNPQSYLMPRCYIATLDGNPFLEEALRGAMDRKLSAIVFGIRKEGDHEN